MTTNRTEQLIVDLAAGLAPVRRVPPVSLRLMRWAVAGVLITAVAVWAMGVRADISAALSVPDVLTTFCLTLLGSVSAAMVALRLSVPGVESRWTRWAPLGLMTLLVAVLVHLAREAGVSPLAIAHEPFHTACVARVAALALVPTWLLVHEIRRGFALDPASTTALAALGGSALAAVAVQLLCPIDRPAHLLVSHVLPALVLVVAGAAAGAITPRLVVAREQR